MSWGAVAGAGIGLVGSMLGGKSQPKQTSTPFRPYAVSNLWGGQTIDRTNGTLTSNLSDFGQRIADMGMFGAERTLADMYGNAQRGSNFADMGATDYMGTYGSVQSYGLPNQSLYAGADAALGQYGNLFGNLAQQSAQNPYALQQMQLGQNFMGAAPRSYQDVASSRLGLLREQAAPFEERAANSLQNTLFSQGRLGSTGGGRDIEAFARGLGQADTARQLDAQTMAEGLYGRDQQYAAQQQAMGANLFSGGANNWMQGLGQAGQLGQLGAGMAGQRYDLGMNWNQAGYTRANDRMARAAQMFGFGNTMQVQSAANADPWLKILSGLTGEQGNLVNQSAALGGGGQTTTAGNPTGQAAGAFLGNLGQGMMTGNIDFGGMMDKWRMRGLEPIDITAKRI